MDIAFRPLVDDDFELLHGWLNDPEVVRWWEGQDVSRAGVRAHYFEPSWPSREQWIALVDGEPVGWLQCYLATENLDETENWWDFGIDKRAAGIDYLVANTARRGAGLGSQMIRAFSQEIVLGRHPDWTQVCAGPFAANVASCRALEKAGFRLVALIEDDEEDPCQLMALHR